MNDIPEIVMSVELPDVSVTADLDTDAVSISVDFDSWGVTSVNGMTGDVVLDIPDRTSDLENDSGFITEADVPIQSVSVNGTGITPVEGNVDIGVPTKTSDINNDSGYITSSDVPITSISVNDTPITPVGGNVNIPVVVPTKTSELTNDSGFITDNYHDDSKQNKLIAGDNITLTPTQSAGTNKFEVVTAVNSGTSATPTSNVAIYPTMWYRGATYNGYLNYSIVTNIVVDGNKVSFRSSDAGSYGLCKFVPLRPSTAHVISWLTSLNNGGRFALSKYLPNAGGTTYKFSRYLVTPTTSPASFTTDADEGALYGVIFYAQTQGVECSYYNIQIEEGTHPTPYVPYQAIYADKIDADVPTASTLLATISGYDATQTQTLKNVNGVFQWVTD